MKRFNRKSSAGKSVRRIALREIDEALAAVGDAEFSRETAIHSVRAEMNIPPATLTALVLAGASAETRARAPRWTDVIKRMARLSEISFADRAPDGAVQLLVRGEVAALPLKGVIDLAAERGRLDKEIAKADADIKRAESKLANEKFVANAAEEVVEEEREKREAALARKAKLLEAMERLKQAG